MAATKTVKLRNVIDLLGGTKVLGELEEPADIQDAIRGGLPIGSLERLTDALDLTDADITTVLGMAPRTLARRKRERHLSPVESDRVYRVARVTQLAVDVLGDLDKARQWLNDPNQALGGAIPLTMLDTEIGARQVEEVLLHIIYGIYA